MSARRRSRARPRARLGVVVAVTLAAALLTPAASAAVDPDPAQTQQQRDDVRAQRAQIDLQVDALQAKDAEVRKALTQLETNVAKQQARLDSAKRAQARADAELDRATRAVDATERHIADLNRRADELVVDSFVHPPTDDALDAFRARSLSDAAIKQALIEMQADSDANVLDQLDRAQRDLEVDKAHKATAAATAEDTRNAAAGALSDVRAALAQQRDFADQVEERLDAKLAEAEALKSVDQALSAKLAREQAELAAKLKATQAAALPPPTDPTPSTIQPVPGGLATVTCPGGGTITIAGSIASNVQALLDAAAADGVMLCGGGYRSPDAQIELRREHCGTSTYAIYEMPASQCDPPTARPGTSMHEQGLAIDFTCNGGGVVESGDVCWDWLVANAATYGLYNLPTEPWHWSTTGD